MEREFLNYEQSLAVKELDFEEGCIDYYFKVYKENVIQLWKRANKLPDVSFPIVNAPLKQQAFRFFREKYGIEGVVQYFTGGYYCYAINDMKDTEKSNRLFTEFETYEEAEEACINKLIEIVKEVSNE